MLDYMTPGRRPPRNWGWVWSALAVACVAGFLGLAGLAILASRKVHVTPAYTVCLGNLRHIAMAVVMYQQEHRRAYPPTLAETYPYLKQPRIYVCPSSDDQPLPAGTPATQPAAGLLTPGACSYVYLGPTLPARPSPKAILLYERNTFHEGRMCVAYADGAARLVDADEAKHILSELAAGHNPPRER